MAPVSAGLVFDWYGTSVAAYFIAVWNLVSVIFEYLLLRLIYKEFPQLAHKKVFEEKVDKDEAKTEITTKTSWNPFSKLKEAFQSWLLYMKYSIRNAGFGLACLYMTVCGFDNVTYGFCLQQCVSDSVLGGLVGLAAIVGVCGSITFPFLRKSLGLAKTGIVGFTSLIGTLCLCVASIWIQGSPFDPKFYSTIPIFENETIVDNSTTTIGLDDCSISSFNSVIVLMTGIIAARFGLWVSDLTVTQILQERVSEEHRGTIGGVQNGLNSAMNTIKFFLVIALPEQETFGWLILASFVSVCIGAVSYTLFAINLTNSKTIEKPAIVYQAVNANDSDVKNGKEDVYEVVVIKKKSAHND